MNEEPREQEFSQALADYASYEVPGNRDLWPNINQRVQQRRQPRPRLHQLNLVAQRPRWVAVSFVLTIMLSLGALGYTLPGAVGQWGHDNLASPTHTYAAELTTGTNTPAYTYAVASVTLAHAPLTNTPRPLLMGTPMPQSFTR